MFTFRGMSWDQYVDSIMAYAPADCDKAAIIGKDGSIWTSGAAGKGMTVAAAEAATLGSAAKSGDFTGLQASGIYLEGKSVYAHLFNDFCFLMLILFLNGNCWSLDGKLVFIYVCTSK